MDISNNAGVLECAPLAVEADEGGPDIDQTQNAEEDELLNSLPVPEEPIPEGGDLDPADQYPEDVYNKMSEEELVGPDGIPLEVESDRNSEHPDHQVDDEWPEIDRGMMDAYEDPMEIDPSLAMDLPEPLEGAVEDDPLVDMQSHEEL